MNSDAQWNGDLSMAIALAYSHLLDGNTHDARGTLRNALDSFIANGATDELAAMLTCTAYGHTRQPDDRADALTPGPAPGWRIVADELMYSADWL